MVEPSGMPWVASSSTNSRLPGRRTSTLPLTGLTTTVPATGVGVGVGVGVGCAVTVGTVMTGGGVAVVNVRSAPGTGPPENSFVATSRKW